MWKQKTIVISIKIKNHSSLLHIFESIHLGLNNFVITGHGNDGIEYSNCAILPSTSRGIYCVNIVTVYNEWVVAEQCR